MLLCIYAPVSRERYWYKHKKKTRTAVSTLPGLTAIDTIFPFSSVANVLITEHECEGTVPLGIRTSSYRFKEFMAALLAL
jgi:hypothetical protein